MSCHAASRSMFDLKICLQKKGSHQNFACIEGAGCARKQCWVQLNELDTVSFLVEAKDPTWIQLVIISAMVAAKTQRHRNKLFPPSMRRGWFSCRLIQRNKSLQVLQIHLCFYYSVLLTHYHFCAILAGMCYSAGN